MKYGAERSSRKRVAILAVAVTAVLAPMGMRRMAQVSQANSDRNNLRQQRAAIGMPDPEQMRARMLDDMARNLGLTATQKGQLKAAMEEGPDPRSVFSDRSLSREQRFERMRELGEARQARRGWHRGVGKRRSSACRWWGGEARVPTPPTSTRGASMSETAVQFRAGLKRRTVGNLVGHLDLWEDVEYEVPFAPAESRKTPLGIGANG